MMLGKQNTRTIISEPITPASDDASSERIHDEDGKVDEPTNEAVGESCSTPGKEDSAADKVDFPKIAIADAVMSNGARKECSDHPSKSIWTYLEEKTLVNHIRKCFDPSFDACEIFSILAEKSEEDIKQKWDSLATSFLDSHERRETAITETKNSADGNHTPSPSKKLKAGGDRNIPSWTYEENRRLQEIMKSHNYHHHASAPHWDAISYHFPGKSPIDCLSQWQSMSSPDQVKGKGSWTPEEDAILRANSAIYGRKWSKIAEYLPGRTGKQCRERFVNHLDPKLKRGEWTDGEEALLIGIHNEVGNKWTLIAKYLPGRSDNDVKNHFYSTITRKFEEYGKEKLTNESIKQVVSMVKNGMVSPDAIKNWPGALSIIESLATETPDKTSDEGERPKMKESSHMESHSRHPHLHLPPHSYYYNPFLQYYNVYMPHHAVVPINPPLHYGHAGYHPNHLPGNSVNAVADLGSVGKKKFD
mmetsp:Transcript_9944/g.20895  ORF Transcript_9944/g.20895 Transcript_9944/m.20895 type:complete len:475 (+) Transcript_9944:107-1531(+)